jgi:hypothetical protein
MMRSRLLVPLLGLVSVAFVAGACSEGGDSPTAGGGAGGESPAPTAGTGGGAHSGAAGEGQAGVGGEGQAGAGGDCATTGSGTLVIEVTGLPSDVEPKVNVAGPTTTENASGSLSVDAGQYVVSAERVYDEDPLVRTVFAPKIATPSFCVGDGELHTLTVAYTAIPSSNKLWLPTGKDTELAGFSSADIAESVATDPSVAIDTLALGSLAFDRDGNLWGVHPIIGEDMLVRIPAAELGASGTRQPDIKISVPELTDFPYINHIAFDPSGNLWLSASGDQLHRLSAADLTDSGDKISDVLFTEVVNNQGIAFDSAGNLWVAGGPTLERFDAARLETSDTDAPDLKIKVVAALDSTVLGPDELAFDKAGNLWGIAGSTLFQLAASKLAGTGMKDVKANVSFDVDVLALPSTPVFDDGNGLWVSLAAGSFGRYAPETLGHSVASGSPVAPDVLIQSDGIDASLPLALFPAPQGLPLYHSLPRE